MLQYYHQEIVCLLPDSISWVFLWSLQYGIVVLGFFDAFVYAHYKHRLDSANAGSFGDCLSGRFRFIAAITPAYAHAYQTNCLAMHFLGVPHHTFQLTQPKSKYPFLRNVRYITRVGNDCAVWAICADGGTRVVDGETVVGCGVISRFPVITSEAHLAFSGARSHSNDTAEMTAMTEALAFCPRGRVTPDELSCFFFFFFF